MIIEYFFWIIGILATIVLSLFGYLLLKNIGVLENVRDVLNEVIIEFAAHKEANKNTDIKVEDLHNRVADIEDEQVAMKLRINTNETLIKSYKHADKDS